MIKLENMRIAVQVHVKHVIPNQRFSTTCRKRYQILETTKRCSQKIQKCQQK